MAQRRRGRRCTQFPLRVQRGHVIAYSHAGFRQLLPHLRGCQDLRSGTAARQPHLPRREAKLHHSASAVRPLQWQRLQPWSCSGGRVQCSNHPSSRAHGCSHAQGGGTDAHSVGERAAICCGLRNDSIRQAACRLHHCITGGLLLRGGCSYGLLLRRPLQPPRLWLAQRPGPLPSCGVRWRVTGGRCR